jgi:hypothetical protein
MRWRMTIAACALVACNGPTVQPVSGGGGSDNPGKGGAGGSSAPTGGLPPDQLPDAGRQLPPAQGPTCAAEVHAAERLPVDLLLLVDVSGSMDELSGTQSKWQLSRAALGAFVKDPGSAGLGVGLSFFPSKTIEEMKACTADQDCAGISDPIAGACRLEGFCFAAGVPLLTNRLCSPRAASNPFNCPAGLTCKPRGRCPQSGGPCVEGGEACPGGAADRCVTTPGSCRTVDEGCNVTAFGRLDLDVGDLPGHAGAVIAALAAREPDGATPMALGVDSALAALFARQKAQPQRRPVLVLATDGQPSGCGPGQSVPAVETLLQKARLAAPSIATYVVGVFAPEEIAEAQPALERFAVAGGTRMPFILATGADLSQRLLAALTEIRQQTVACDYGIPRPQMGTIDFDRVNVRTTSTAGTQEPAYVGSADRCQAAPGGWYYDPPPSSTTTPSRLVLCPSTCERLRADPAARVELIYGCTTVTIK